MPSSKQARLSKRLLESIVTAIALFYAVWLMAQHAQKPSSPKYDAQTETQMKGTVDDLRMPSSENEIVYLLMKTGTDSDFEVYLCPKSFLDDMGLTFAKGEQIILTGSKVKQGDADLVLAREIVKGTDTIVLRDDKGKPVWN
jgi:hypothetical protein